MYIFRLNIEKRELLGRIRQDFTIREASVKNFNSFKMFGDPVPNYKEKAFFMI